ncbi:hypothetical protein E5720_16375 [Rhodococcus sp. PAMC28707]|uniref:DUF6361 family protein n=1 Tax=unclassified Rhodococcus (in: high G+C Gram-positive bacteria) TaxID=192944 RepID=UPI00109DD12E|nr:MULTISPECIES: DUF6361 family protein [unclassified Rhodococcus (in: high G+C Gram-positive bacteria)]QCB51995.1 hypothetical protein E5769_19145 [Rhodococcus sp. PAMC28705]QCB59836.1 hypothetical protein E5720_16375 [Rhodococcus sp. PAMC28707]
MSEIAWLDTSPDEERRMRELVKLFSDSGTLDDIGIGQVRDTLADQLFPATSTVHTRAKYFLFVPWIYAEAARKHSGTAVRTKARDAERKLIEVMRKSGHTEGLIGRVAGVSVNTLPSNLYWAALKRLGIRVDNQLTSSWNISIDAPQGFPSHFEDGFSLSHAEASWLQERILMSAPTSYLAHLVRDGLDVDIAAVERPWDHPALQIASEEIRSLVEHARLFSLAIHGAGLLYNLLLAEKYAAVMTASGASYADDYREELKSWSAELADNSQEILNWNVVDFWKTVNSSRTTPIPLGTRMFVDAWLTAVRSGDATDPAASRELCRLVADRERANKGEQSRLNNDRLLKQWSGSSGASRLAYRWFNVRTLVGDIKEGLNSAAS